MTSKTLAKNAAKLALSKKAFDVVILDLRTLTSMADFFVICSADSDTQVRAIADAVQDGMKKKGESMWHSEGKSDSQWMLLDFVNVVVHVFHKNTRAFYNLEKLWGDAPAEQVEDKPAASHVRAVRTAGKKSRGAGSRTAGQSAVKRSIR
ncbi:MAG: ribosome silencing factor [Bacteroidota bacterium]|nr:ribosome silencing factor [Bacteroidota bacterium]